MWIAFSSGLDVCYMDVSGSLFCLFLLPRSTQKDCRGSRGKHENELQPAASQDCQL